MAVLSPSTNALFLKAGSFARKTQTFGEPESATSLALLRDAISALESERDTNPVLVDQYIAEMNQYITEIETSDANAAAQKEEAAKTTPTVTLEKDNTTTQTNTDGSSESSSQTGTTYTDKDGTRSSTNEEAPTNNNAGQPDYSGNAGAVPGVQVFDDGSTLQTFDDGSTLATDSEGGVSSSPSLDVPTGKVSSNLVRGMGSSGGGAKAEWKDAKDLRAILRVPKSYLTSNTDPSSVLKQFGGIIFPYTPTISFDHSATYSPLNTLHSNYTQFFYKNSAISAINLTARFTVQKEEDGVVLLGIIHLLRSLTKMRFGPDKDSGAPPPVCRLEAYGDYMLRNVPVAVASFRHDLPDGVDYIAVGKKSTMFGNNIVPVLSTISLTLNPMYSRAEMQEAGVSDWLNGKQRGKGYL